MSLVKHLKALHKSEAVFVLIAFLRVTEFSKSGERDKAIIFKPWCI
jgi:hypothetical protein